MGNISEVLLRGDTSSIISDWEDAITLFRATWAPSTNGAGERKATWAQFLVTTCDIQETPGRFRTKTRVIDTGLNYVPEKEVYFRHGLDLRINDRFALSDGHTYYINIIIYDEDKIQTFAGKHPRED
jgi:hypothetical protein